MMSIADRSARFTWEGPLNTGYGKLAAPQRLQVETKVTLAEVDSQPTITTSQLQVRGQVPGIDADKFSAIVDEAATSCPVSRLFAGADITVEAQLDESA